MNTVPQATDADTIVSAPNKRSTATRASLRADDKFFLAVAIFSLGAIFLGFARTYHLSGIYHTHLPNLFIEVGLPVSWVLGPT